MSRARARGFTKSLNVSGRFAGDGLGGVLPHSGAVWIIVLAAVVPTFSPPRRAQGWGTPGGAVMWHKTRASDKSVGPFDFPFDYAPGFGRIRAGSTRARPWRVCDARTD
jgi:hypothetical protein